MLVKTTRNGQHQRTHFRDVQLLNFPHLVCGNRSLVLYSSTTPPNTRETLGYSEYSGHNLYVNLKFYSPKCLTIRRRGCSSLAYRRKMATDRFLLEERHVIQTLSHLPSHLSIYQNIHPFRKLMNYTVPQRWSKILTLRKAISIIRYPIKPKLRHEDFKMLWEADIICCVSCTPQLYQLLQVTYLTLHLKYRK